MEPIQDFAGLICRLRSLKERKRVVVVCPNDPHTEYVITRSLHEGFADFLLVADTPHLLNSEYIRLQYPDHVKVYEATSPDKAAQEAVSLIREGHADVLMKGIINTDNLLRAVLNKEHGILPKGNVRAISRWHRSRCTRNCCSSRMRRSFPVLPWNNSRRCCGMIWRYAAAWE